MTGLIQNALLFRRTIKRCDVLYSFIIKENYDGAENRDNIFLFNGMKRKAGTQKESIRSNRPYDDRNLICNFD